MNNQQQCPALDYFLLTLFVFFLADDLEEDVFLTFVADLVTFFSLFLSFLISTEEAFIAFSFSSFNIFSASSFEIHAQIKKILLKSKRIES